MSKKNVMIAATLLLSACQPDTPLSSHESARTVTQSTLLSASKLRPGEQWLADIEREVPGFGGMTMDRDGRVKAFLVDTTKASLLAAVITKRFESGALPLSAGMRIQGITVHPAIASVSQLGEWRDRAFDALSRGELVGVHGLDLREQENRVQLNVASDNARAMVESKSMQLGIPREAVIIAVSPEPKFSTAPVALPPSTINGIADTIVGGLGITWEAKSDTVNRFFCTTGFTVMTSSGPRVATAAHCSSTVWGADSSAIRQGPEFSTPRIANEVLDPPGYACGFRTCRASDAALHALNAGVKSRVGAIARTTGSGSTAWNSSPAYWQISGVESNNMYTGFGLTAQGRTSGERQQFVVLTCYDYSPSSSNRTVTCTTVAGGSAMNGGDSGGPVFWIKPPTTNQIILAGVISGVDGNNVIFSPFQRIAGNLGISIWNVVDPELYPAQPVISGAVNGGSPGLTWPSVPTASVYKLYREWYRYASEEGSGGFQYVGDVTSPFVDTFAVDAYTGTVRPSFSTEGYVSYYLVAQRSDGTQGQPSEIKHFRLAP